MKPETVLITGSNRGIGLQLVKEILKLDFPPCVLIAACRDPAKAEDLKVLAKSNENLKLLKLDIQHQLDEDSLCSLTEEVRGLLGGRGLNLLINNAGILIDGEPSLDGLMTTFTINSFAPLLITKALIPLLKQASSSYTPLDKWSVNRAMVLNVSSGAGSITRMPDSEIIMYRGSKTALNMFTKNLSIEYGGDGILFIAMCPGAVVTDMAVQINEYLERRSDITMQTLEESCSKITQLLTEANSKHQGKFLRNSGEELPW